MNSESSKPNCRVCVFQARSQVSTGHHISCQHPSVAGDPVDQIVNLVANTPKIQVIGDQMAIQKGWFSWPLDFDPTWLESCNGFKERTT